MAFILRAVGDSRSSLLFLLITSVLNIALDLLFVAVFRWGVAGVAVATIISQFVSMIMSFIYMLKKHPVLRPDRESLRLDAEIAKDIFRIGMPVVLQQMVTSCGFMLLQNIVNGFGANMTASYTVACRLEIYMLVPGGAFTQAMAVYAGQNYGAGRVDRIRKGLGQAVLMAEITALSVAAIMLLFARRFVGLFALEESAAVFCVRHLHAVCLGIVINVGYSAVNGMFQGVGRTKISMTSSIIELSNRLIWAMILKNIIFEAAVWWNEPPVFFLAGLFSYLCFIFYKK